MHWHRGRCLSYGEGVAYWALAEMVRTRLRITEDDVVRSINAKLREGLEARPDRGGARLARPRLAVLLGLVRGSPRQEIVRRPGRRGSSGWPVRRSYLVFEDAAWADDGLLDFLDHLVDWSRGDPRLVATLARPELLERRPSLGGRPRDGRCVWTRSTTMRWPGWSMVWSRG